MLYDIWSLDECLLDAKGNRRHGDVTHFVRQGHHTSHCASLYFSCETNIEYSELVLWGELLDKKKLGTVPST